MSAAGYEYHGPKQFVLESNQNPGAIPFEIIDAAGATIFEGEVPEGARIFGAYGSD